MPTLSPGVKVPATMEGNPFFTDAIKEKAYAASRASQKGFSMAYQITFGTDTGVTHHGDNADEFQMMVGAGMSPADAVRSATVVTAELLEMSDRIGTLESGKLADLIAVRGNPLEDVSVLTRVTAVVKSGELVSVSP